MYGVGRYGGEACNWPYLGGERNGTELLDRAIDGGGRSGDRVRLTAAAKQWVAAVTSADKVLTGGGA